MRLFDPDGRYALFGKFDGTGKAIALSRRLEMALPGQGHAHGPARLHGRANRSTPLVRAVLGCVPEDKGGPPQKECDARTCVLFGKGDVGGTAPMVSVIRPPEDAERKKALLIAAMNRL